jgi:hypothetical protein
MTMTMTTNPRVRKVKAKAVGFVQSPLGVGGATFTAIGLVDLVAHLGPNGILAASLAGIATYFFKDEIFVWVGNATGHPYISDKAISGHEQKYGLLDDGDEGEKRLPEKVIRYADIEDQIPPGKMLLGVWPDTGKLELSGWQKLKCLWIVGSSSMGKSNTVYGKALEAVKGGAKLLIVDQHASKPGSLAKLLQGFEHAFWNGQPVARTDEQVLAHLQMFKEELERRVAGASRKQKIVLICDEMNRMARNPKLLAALKEVVAICGEESRGFGMYGWFISQKAVHLKWLRDSAITRIAHAVESIEEAMLICNDDRKAAKRLLDFHVGRTFVKGGDFDLMELQQALYGEDESDEDDEDIEIELEDDDDPLNDLNLGKRQASPSSQKLSIQVLMNWYERGEIDQAQLLAFLKQIRVGDQKEPLTVVDADPPDEKEPSLLERCVAAYKEGATTQPAMASAVGVKVWTIRQIWPDLMAEVKRLGLLDE